MANVQNSIAQYPKGFTAGVTIRGMPILNSYSGNVWYVDSNGAQIGDGKFNRPFATIDTAINHASAGDIIVVKAGHTETLVAAGAITLDVAGVSVIGLGTGNNRPKLTFTPLAVGTAPVSWTAANVSFENIVCISGLDAMTTPFAISGAQAHLDIEWQDASASIEAATVVQTTTAADKININLVYRGFTAGNACVSPIKLDGATDARINVDFYGLASTAVVEFADTLSTNVLITGYAYNSTDTTGVKLVVDTVGSSLWYAEIYAGAAGQKFKGGSGLALAGDPTISAVTDALYGDNGVTAWGTEAAAANGVAFDEVLLYIQNAVRRGSGTSMAANKSVADALGTDGVTLVDDAASVVGILGVNDSNNAFSSSSVTADADGSILERLEYLQSASLQRMVAKASTSPLTTGTLFNYAGSVRIHSIIGRVTTIIQGQATTVKLSVTPDALAAYDICATKDINGFAVGSLLSITGTAANGMVSTTAVGSIAPGQVGPVDITCITTGTVTVTYGAASTGAISWEVLWQPMAAGSTLTAA